MHLWDRSITAFMKPSSSLAARATVLVVLVSGMATPAVPARAQDPARPAPRLVLPDYPVKADDQFQWSIPIKVVNSTPRGIYVDSMWIEIEDRDPGETRRPRRSTFTVTSVAKLLPSVSAGDSGAFKYQGRAFSELAHLSLRLHTHDGDGTPFVSAGEMTVVPGMMSDHFQSTFMTHGKDRIEYVLVPEVWPPRASPGLLILHGEGGHARTLLPAAWHLANRGYSVMLVSLPGYGLSSGPADLAGKRAIAAAEAALDLLRRSPGIDSTRIAVWGVSQGATTALHLASRRRDFKAVLAQSGLYDLVAVARTTTSEEMRTMLREEAGSEREWKRRSPTTLIKHLTLPIMVVHGEADSVTPLGQATEFVTALKAAGRDVALKLLPAQDHRIPLATARDIADEFFEPYLHPVRKGRQ